MKINDLGLASAKWGDILYYYLIRTMILVLHAYNNVALQYCSVIGVRCITVVISWTPLPPREVIDDTIGTYMTTTCRLETQGRASKNLCLLGILNVDEIIIICTYNNSVKPKLLLTQFSKACCNNISWLEFIIYLDNLYAFINIYWPN